nr:MAG: hypothetical protein [Usmuvirus newyorkense]
MSDPRDHPLLKAAIDNRSVRQFDESEPLWVSDDKAVIDVQPAEGQILAEVKEETLPEEVKKYGKSAEKLNIITPNVSKLQAALHMSSEYIKGKFSPKKGRKSKEAASTELKTAAQLVEKVKQSRQKKESAAKISRDQDTEYESSTKESGSDSEEETRSHKTPRSRKPKLHLSSESLESSGLLLRDMKMMISEIKHQCHQSIRELAHDVVKSQSQIQTTLTIIADAVIELKQNHIAIKDDLKTIIHKVKESNTGAQAGMARIIELDAKHAEGVVQGLERMDKAYAETHRILTQQIDCVRSEVTNIKGIIGSFDAHLVSMAQRPIQAYQTNYPLPTMTGPSMEQAEIIRAPLVPAVEVMTETVFSQKLAVLQQMTNMGRIELFTKFPDIAKAYTASNYEKAVRLIDEYIKNQ